MPKSRFKHCSLFVQSDIVCFEWQGHVPVSQFVPMNVGFLFYFIIFFIVFLS